MCVFLMGQDAQERPGWNSAGQGLDVGPPPESQVMRIRLWGCHTCEWINPGVTPWLTPVRRWLAEGVTEGLTWLLSLRFPAGRTRRASLPQTYLLSLPAPDQQATSAPLNCRCQMLCGSDGTQDSAC